MRLYLWEVKKLSFPPFFLMFLFLVLGINILVISDYRLEPEEQKEMLYIEKVRNEKGISTFLEAKENKDVFVDIISEYELENEQFYNKDFGLGKNTMYLFSFLIGDVFRLLFIENVIMCILMVVFVFGVENVSDMEQMIYAAKTGRHILWQKLWISISVVLVGAVLISTTTIGYFAISKNIPTFWNIKMNCPYLHEGLFGVNIYSLLSNITVLEYIQLVSLMMIVMSVSITIFVFSVMYLWSNLLKGTGAIIIVILLDYAVSNILLDRFPKHKWQGSFASMYLTIRYWLTDMNGCYMFKYQDVILVSGMLMLTIVLLFICFWRMRRRNMI